MHRIWLTAGLVLACAAAAAGPASAQDDIGNDYMCFDSNEEFTPEQQVAGCNTMIRGGNLPDQDLAAVFAMRGWSYQELGDFPAALADYSEKIRLQPDAADGYGWRGAVYLQQSDYEKALADYSRAIELGPDADDVALWYHDRGAARYNLGDHPAALADYDQTLALITDDPMFYTDRGYVHFELKDFARAIADYTKAINLAPDDAANWNDRCWGRAVWGRELVEALDDCNEAVALDPANFNAWDSRGLVYLRMQEWEAALADYEASLDIETSASAYYGRGIARQRLGQQQDAEANFATALRLDPEIAATYAGYGVEP
jgi:tetratricopeptide (TPR) repeat protein